jgi:Protein of unknown function (DUF3551)
MTKVMTAAFALSALFAASGKLHAEVNYPWCIIGDTRGYECVFSSREQCAQDGRNRGFGGQCIQNPAYNPGRPPTASGTKQTEIARPLVSAAQSTCTGLKSACLSGKDCGYGSAPCGGPNYCNRTWEHCMKMGFWEGAFIHRPAERR